MVKSTNIFFLWRKFPAKITMIYTRVDSRDLTMCSIVDQLVPASYLQLQDIIQSLVSDCRMMDKVPIFDKETYR